MDLKFLNKDRELVGIIDNAQSIQWLERYYEIGTFEVYVQATNDVLDIVNQSYFIARDDSTYVGVIEQIANEDDVENGNFLIISGRMAESLIGRRIIRNITYLTNTSLYNICNNLLQANILNPILQAGETISPRKMFCLNTQVINDLKNNLPLNVQASYEDNLLEYIQELLKTNKSSIRLELQEDGMFNVILYEGTDRSYEQEENPYVVFSKEYDNLFSSNYIYNSQEEANAIYVGGEDNDYQAEGRYVDKYDLLPDGSVASDVDRKELYVDAGDIKFRYAAEWNDETKVVEPAMTSSEYRELLINRGKSSIVRPSEELSATVDLTMYEYNKDYFLGDIVSTYNEALETYLSKRLIGMDIVDDENGRTLDPTFENVEPVEAAEESNGYILTENLMALRTEDEQNLVVESYSSEDSGVATASSIYTGNVKISQLEEVTTEEVQEGCCMPIVSSGDTKRITYGVLKEKLSNELNIDLSPMTNSELENILK